VLEPGSYYSALDGIYNVTVENRLSVKDLVIRFASMPGTAFRMEGYGSVYDVEELRGWSGVWAGFYCNEDRKLVLLWLGEA